MAPQAPLVNGNYAKVAPALVFDQSFSDDETIHHTNNGAKGTDQVEDTVYPPSAGSVGSVGSVTGVHNWGFPGFLNKSQAQALEQLRMEVKKRSKDFQDTIFTSRESNEDESYAMCRWLRTNKFSVNKTIRKVEEATLFSADARKNNYYHCPTDVSHALGIAPSIYLQKFPQFYYGVTKCGLPIFYGKPGVIDTKAIGCMTSAKNILQYHWYGMYQERNDAFKARYEASNGTFKRYERLYILDLKHLSLSLLNKPLLNTTKAQCKIDELCFPDSMMKMIIVNAPSCFPIFWRIAKAWIDARSASKVEIFGCNKDLWEKRISEFVEKDQLPSDYGGLLENGTSEDIMRQQMIAQYKLVSSEYEMVDEETHLMSFHQQQAIHRVEVKAGLKLSLTVYTNSKSGGFLQITDEDDTLIDGIPSNEGIQVIHVGGDNNDSEMDVSTSTLPTKYDLKELGINLDVPGFYDVKISIKEKLRGNFLLVTHYYKESTEKNNDQGQDQDCEDLLSNSSKTRKIEYIQGLKSYSLGTGSFSLNNVEDDGQVQFYPYEYICDV